ncbi:putative formamidopyrimidine-DNA glycosylase-like protein [Streptomyces netropsis]|uniref:Formamidopyrimidine-DNA glycosylase n=1 Tax=Streptomyces syringium TaxID=76729 RepID=A0ABS4YC63_9ACTN|nr:DNA-formamidopyrimidine glycosylase family protein [Streptomyces syringium]MBP2406324.1 formamidopyrimidine-DNA glycosylase [Streptomyces syringium]SPE63780.1 putative formamidopyrimidine-DNA glycosylase-like protein [Streptomyces netropsis]
MPELPEVEALAGFLTEHLVGRTVERVLPLTVSVLKTYDPPLTDVEGRTVVGVRRHGKFLDLVTDGPHLVLHLARAGWLRWRDPLPDAPPRPGKGPLALRVRLAGPGGDGFDLTEAGTQKRLAVYCVRDVSEVPGIARLGPDPLAPEFTLEVFAGLLREERRQLKGVLRDQSVIAGIGNAYSDEILHAARMSPFKLAASLTEEETSALYAALGATLRDALERSRGHAAGELKAEKKSGLRVHGRTGQPCPVCGDTIREVSYRDSSLQYCPTCQTGGKPLADRRLSRLLK